MSFNYYFICYCSYFDIEISDNLKMVKESDVEGKIILVVLTRLDIMIKGIDVRKRIIKSRNSI